MSSFLQRLSGGSSSRQSQYQETQQSELERLRGRQLASLVRAGGRAKNQSQTAFEVPVCDTQRGPLVLTVTLPTDFPIRAPHVQASMSVQHPWLDPNGTVQAHADLNQWTAHSDVGRIVTEIAEELRRLAATLLAQKGSGQSSYPAPYQYPASGMPPPAPAPTPTPSPPKDDPPQLQRSQMPVIPAVFPELEELSVSQLENLANDRHALKAFAKKIMIAQEFLKLREDVMKGNMNIAEKTLGYEDRMRELQAEVADLRSDLHASQTALAEKQARQHRIIARHRPDALLEQLSAATKAIDETSDELAHQFTHGNISFQQFTSEYLPQRTLYHERTLKLNRVVQQ